jgi:hypothetical protein
LAIGTLETTGKKMSEQTRFEDGSGKPSQDEQSY